MNPTAHSVMFRVVHVVNQSVEFLIALSVPVLGKCCQCVDGFEQVMSGTSCYVKCSHQN